MSHVFASTEDNDSCFTQSQATQCSVLAITDDTIHAAHGTTTPPSSPLLRAAPSSASSSVSTMHMTYTTMTCDDCNEQDIPPIRFYMEHIAKKCYSECAVSGCGWKGASNALAGHMELHADASSTQHAAPANVDLQLKVCILEKQLETVQNELKAVLARAPIQISTLATDPVYSASTSPHHTYRSMNNNMDEAQHPARSLPEQVVDPEKVFCIISEPVLPASTKELPLVGVPVMEAASAVPSFSSASASAANEMLGITPDTQDHTAHMLSHAHDTCGAIAAKVPKKMTRKRKSNSSAEAISRNYARSKSLRTRVTSNSTSRNRTYGTADTLCDLVAAAELIDAGHAPLDWKMDDVQTTPHADAPPSQHVRTPAFHAALVPTITLPTISLCNEDLYQPEQVQVLAGTITTQHQQAPAESNVVHTTTTTATDTNAPLPSTQFLQVQNGKEETITPSGDTTDEDEPMLQNSRSTISPRTTTTPCGASAELPQTSSSLTSDDVVSRALTLKPRRPKFTLEEQAIIAHAFYIFEAWKCYPDPVTGSNDESSKAATKHVWSHIVRYYFPQYARDSGFSKALRNYCRRFVTTIRGPRDAAATEEYERIMSFLNQASVSSLAESNTKKMYAAYPTSSETRSSAHTRLPQNTMLMVPTTTLQPQPSSSLVSPGSTFRSTSRSSSSSPACLRSAEAPHSLMTTSFVLGRSAKRTDGPFAAGSLFSASRASTATAVSSTAATLFNTTFVSSSVPSSLLNTHPLHFIPSYPGTQSASSARNITFPTFTSEHLTPTSRVTNRMLYPSILSTPPHHTPALVAANRTRIQRVH